MIGREFKKFAYHKINCEWTTGKVYSTTIFFKITFEYRKVFEKLKIKNLKKKKKKKEKLRTSKATGDRQVTDMWQRRPSLQVRYVNITPLQVMQSLRIHTPATGIKEITVSTFALIGQRFPQVRLEEQRSGESAVQNIQGAVYFQKIQGR